MKKPATSYRSSPTSPCWWLLEPAPHSPRTSCRSPHRRWAVSRPTMQESVHKWREQPSHLPEDAPNILIVMLDDAGFGQPSAFGGEIQTPTLSRSPRRASPITPSTPPRCARRPGPP